MIKPSTNAVEYTNEGIVSCDNRTEETVLLLGLGISVGVG